MKQFTPKPKAMHQAPKTPDVSSYWYVRLTMAVDQLETEARRMLRLEEELSAFALRYYDTLSPAVQRLDALEQQLMQRGEDPVPEFEDMVTQCEIRAARRIELKKRYRDLGKQIHPDRIMVVEGTGFGASAMYRLNMAYQKSDLAALLKLEAELMLVDINEVSSGKTKLLEAALYEIKRAAETYAEGYRTLLGSPLNTLMLRAMSARLTGWDWIDAALRKVERHVEEKERALYTAIAAFDELQEPSQVM